MPTNEELEKQIEELRELIAENKQATKERWSDSPWAIGLQILIAVAAVAIAWAQFNAAAIQTDLSSKQTSLQEFEIIKSLSTLRPNDTLAVDNLFDYISTLDEDLQKRFLNNNLNSRAVNYFNYRSYGYLFEHFEFDTVSTVGGLMTKIADYLSEQRLNHIKSEEATTADYRLVEHWLGLILQQTRNLGFESRKELLIEHSQEFVTGLMILRDIVEYRNAKPTGIKMQDSLDTSLVYRLIPYDFKLFNSLFGRATPTTDFKQTLSSFFTLKQTLISRGERGEVAEVLTNNYMEDKYRVFLLYIKESENEGDFDRYLSLCKEIINTQETHRSEIPGIILSTKVPQASGYVQKSFYSNFRLWLDEEKLVSLKKAADAGQAYDPQLPEKN